MSTTAAPPAVRPEEEEKPNTASHHQHQDQDHHHHHLTSAAVASNTNMAKKNKSKRKPKATVDSSTAAPTVETPAVNVEATIPIDYTETSLAIVDDVVEDNVATPTNEEEPSNDATSSTDLPPSDAAEAVDEPAVTVAEEKVADTEVAHEEELPTQPVIEVATNEQTSSAANIPPTSADEPAATEDATPNSNNDSTISKDIVQQQPTDNILVKDNALIVDETDLRNPNRRIWVVTTAAMPWRTGTAVNPLMRALYLTRGRPKHYVTLVIPWLPDVESQQKLFGAGHLVFHDAPSQEAWIRTFCRERANCAEEEANLRILFYASKYHTVLGSIFPSEDICSLIPDDEADVAILEEPEHLNWFRIPSISKHSNTATADDNDSDEGDEVEANNNNNISEPPSKGVEVVYGKETQLKERNHLGWAMKFRYVVGILHTNYAAYMGQYGFGTSIIAAPALSLLSSIVVRAYCNRVIRLSAALPPLAPHKEVTSNVHGVRSEFLDPPTPKPASSITTATTNTETTGGVDTIDTNTLEPYAAVYFIGKVIWAKGFDKVLEVEELYRQKTGHYFTFDIYGGGPDEKAIRRAFFGRKGGSAAPSRSPSGCESPPNETKEMASKVFGSTESLRGLLLHAKQAFTAAVMECSHENTSAETAEEPEAVELSVTADEDDDVVLVPTVAGERTTKKSTEPVNPLSVLGDLSGKSVSTGLAASKAVYKLADKLVKKGISMTFDNAERGAEDDSNSALVFSPPQSRFEWRRNPIPARFRGVIDHVEVRDILENKIFLNMSTTEVLCTTTAEALAMGKFVILPDHPSNEFFLKFPNCLAYTSIEECVEKLHCALEHDPQPLSEEHRRAFSWEGATDRLFEASQMTIDEKKKSDTTDKEDKGVAKFHVDSMIKGHLLTKFFAGDK